MILTPEQLTELRRRIPNTSLVPGGIQTTDHVHIDTNDGTCSRCRKAIGEDEVPLMLWSRGGRDMLIYCNDCDALEHFEIDDDDGGAAG